MRRHAGVLPKNPTMRGVFANLQSFWNTDDGAPSALKDDTKISQKVPTHSYRAHDKTKTHTKNDAFRMQIRLITYINIALISLTETKLCVCVGGGGGSNGCIYTQIEHWAVMFLRLNIKNTLEICTDGHKTLLELRLKKKKAGSYIPRHIFLP